MGAGECGAGVGSWTTCHISSRSRASGPSVSPCVREPVTLHHREPRRESGWQARRHGHRTRTSRQMGRVMREGPAGRANSTTKNISGTPCAQRLIPPNTMTRARYRHLGFLPAAGSRTPPGLSGLIRGDIDAAEARFPPRDRDRQSGPDGDMGGEGPLTFRPGLPATAAFALSEATGETLRGGLGRWRLGILRPRHRPRNSNQTGPGGPASAPQSSASSSTM